MCGRVLPLRKGGWRLPGGVLLGSDSWPLQSALTPRERPAPPLTTKCLFCGRMPVQSCAMPGFRSVCSGFAGLAQPRHCASAGYPRAVPGPSAAAMHKDRSSTPKLAPTTKPTIKRSIGHLRQCWRRFRPRMPGSRPDVCSIWYTAGTGAPFHALRPEAGRTGMPARGRGKEENRLPEPPPDGTAWAPPTVH